MSYKPGDIVFSKSKYFDPPTAVMFAGPILVTKVHNDRLIDICFLNNSHTNKPQGLGCTYTEDYMSMNEVPDEWRDILAFWVTRAICSTDPNLAMTYEAGQAAPSELERLGLA